jgi:hypothetical protein
MRRNLMILTVITGTGLALASGCGQTDYPAALDATLEEVDQIRDPNQDMLTPSEKRDALAAFGIDPVTINGLLEGERLANQFGGDLSSAYEKVANDRLPDLTPDELQYYADATDTTTYGDAEAQAIVDFFAANEINSLADVEDFITDPTKVLPSDIDETSLRSVFVDTSLDTVRDKVP